MIRDFVLSLVAFFIVDPFKAELNQKLAAVHAPAEIVREVQRCAATATPILLERTLSDWWWAGTTALSVSIGMTTPEQVLVEVAPACGPAVRAAQPFLNSVRA